ncbi:MAG: CRTAC1 family protein [Pirellulales bacterium]
MSSSMDQLQCEVIAARRRVRRRRAWYLPLSTAMLTVSLIGCGKSSTEEILSTAGKTKGGDQAIAPSARIEFEDWTERSGIKAAYDNSESTQAFSILESLGGGVGLLDFDRDGRLDVWYPGGGRIDAPSKTITGLPHRLFRQTEMLRWELCSDAAHMSAAKFFSHGCSAADCDSDGFPDLVVTGYGGVEYYRNLGDGTFEEVAQRIGLTDSKWSSSSAFGDLNNDGFPDLYLTHYVNWSWDNDPKCFSPAPDNFPDVCTPAFFQGIDDTVYLNDGQGSFRDASAEMGLVKNGKGLGVAFADIDDDNDLDIYVANDTTENFLYVNDGKGSLIENGLISGTALDQRGTPNGSMGIAVFDFDLDQKPDIWITNFENETFGMYRNLGGANFQCFTDRTGINALGTLFVGFGTVAIDVELDGDEDLLVSNGHVQKHPKSSTNAQEALLLLNDARGHLSKHPFRDSSYFQGRHRGRTVVTADFNHDGLMDCLFAHVLEPASVLLNKSEPQGTWLQLELIGVASNRDAIGARVVTKSTPKPLYRQVVGGSGYLSQGPYSLHFGLPAGTEQVSVEVRWPSGKVQVVNGLRTGMTNVIRETSD